MLAGELADGVHHGCAAATAAGWLGRGAEQAARSAAVSSPGRQAWSAVGATGGILAALTMASTTRPL